MTAYFSLIYDDYSPNIIMLLTSNNKEYIDDSEGVQEKLEIKLEKDLTDLEFIALGVQEGHHEINVLDNAEQTKLYAYQIFENLTSKGWIYVAEGVMIGDNTEVIFEKV